MEHSSFDTFLYHSIGQSKLKSFSSSLKNEHKENLLPIETFHLW